MSSPSVAVVEASSQLSRNDLSQKVAIILAFVVGFFAGYKTKEWRMRWLKFRRDRLAKKLADVQRQVDLMAPSI